MNLKIRNDNWMIWEFWDHEEFYGLTVHDKTYLDKKSQVKFAQEFYLKIIIPENKSEEGLFPSAIVNQELNAIDDALIKLLTLNKVDCKNVQWMTYFGAKRYVYEVNDTAGFKRCVEHWKTLISPYQLAVSTEPSWTIYNENAPDEYAWIQYNNQNLIKTIQNKVGLSHKVYVLEFNIVGQAALLNKVISDLKSEKAKITHHEGGSCNVTFEAKLILDEINELCYFIHNTCEKNNCKYDGWSVKI